MKINIIELILYYIRYNPSIVSNNMIKQYLFENFVEIKRKDLDKIINNDEYKKLILDYLNSKEIEFGSLYIKTNDINVYVSMLIKLNKLLKNGYKTNEELVLLNVLEKENISLIEIDIDSL